MDKLEQPRSAWRCGVTGRLRRSRRSTCTMLVTLRLSTLKSAGFSNDTQIDSSFACVPIVELQPTSGIYAGR